MITHRNDKWVPQPHKITIEEQGNVNVVYTDDLKYWEDMEEMWEHITIVEVEPAELSAEQEARLDEVNRYSVPETYDDYVKKYVIRGVFPNELSGEEKLDVHPLSGIQNEKQQTDNLLALADLDIQREVDKTQSELALAELAEALMEVLF